MRVFELDLKIKKINFCKKKFNAREIIKFKVKKKIKTKGFSSLNLIQTQSISTKFIKHKMKSG